ncbi:hypothetical protein F0L74_20585 [Chitinophaga agrisoli]|uniref:Uncharacterized protein n=1 Tax=Chitinophaga agrisoli TaxID=2607653 RepID=A0A5B2VI68_9BACT|nr:hypothetical protein [Chitinophaga agrisoli]KAA2238624.1 hypothetical protein F0L74_20585 [Chitinophaga agrisoli]
MIRKNIQSFINKLQEHQDGTMSGGFGALRGGASSVLFSTNTSGCTNSGTSCSGSNSPVCTNTVSCSGSNSLHCSNQGVCS